MTLIKKVYGKADLGSNAKTTLKTKVKKLE